MSSGVAPLILETAAREVEVELAQALERLTFGAPLRLREAMAYSLLGGGKRLRPSLVWAACIALGRPVGPEDRDWACALEMVHTYSLIHDDLPAMDNDDLRRGRPTSHKVYGDAVAVLAGDALLTDAFRLLAGATGGSEKHRMGLVQELAGAAGSSGMVGGQVDDVLATARTREELRSMHARKTGALIRAACRGPALVAAPEYLVALTTYGEQVGLAFQISDDLLDVEGSAEAMGKTTSKDATLGKVTYPALIGVQPARQAALDAVESACAAVSSLPGDAGSLVALARYMVARER